MNLDVVIQTFMNEQTPFYLFTTDTCMTRTQMCSHGLHDDNLNRDQCERALCFHILSGLCACSDISRSCTSLIEMELVVLHITISAHKIMIYDESNQNVEPQQVPNMCILNIE